MYGLEPIVVWGLLSYGAEHTFLSLQFVIPVLDLGSFSVLEDFWLQSSDGSFTVRRQHRHCKLHE